MRREQIPEVLGTAEAAEVLHTTPDTMYTNHSRFGHFHGIKPVRIGRKLGWPASQIARLLRGERLEAQ